MNFSETLTLHQNCAAYIRRVSSWTILVINSIDLDSVNYMKCASRLVLKKCFAPKWPSSEHFMCPTKHILWLQARFSGCTRNCKQTDTLIHRTPVSTTAFCCWRDGGGVESGRNATLFNALDAHTTPSLLVQYAQPHRYTCCACIRSS